MDINKIDFYNLCLEEGAPFYGDIFVLEKNKFNQWVKDNLREIAIIDSYDTVLPSEAVLEKLSKAGYEHIHYQCHYSAKSVTILDQDFRYFTGFVYRNSLNYNLLTHSFNYTNDSIIDLARINDPDYSLTDEECGLPNTYYGIEIPREFVLKFQEETFKKKSMKPLLYEWYLENN